MRTFYTLIHWLILTVRLTLTVMEFVCESPYAAHAKKDARCQHYRLLLKY